MTTALAHLSWPPNSANTAAWIAATTPTGAAS